MKLQHKRVWLRVLAFGARYPWVGIVVALIFVTVLVPILALAGGGSGALGPSIPLFFLVPVLIASTVGGTWSGVVASVVAIMAWDWYFIPPVHTVTVYYPRDLLALVVFLAVALLTGQLASASRRQTEEAMQRARTSRALYELSMALIGRRDLTHILRALSEGLVRTFMLEACAVLLPDRRDHLWRAAAVAGSMPDDLRVENSRAVAGITSLVNATGQASGLQSLEAGMNEPVAGSPSSSPGRRNIVRFLPLCVDSRSVGVLELVHKSGFELDSQGEQLLATFANGAALALEQVRMAREEQDAAVARESDRLKTALLSAVSHDLRTPLAGIKAAATSLLQHDLTWSDQDRRAFAMDIDQEADRLTRLVSNLLDLSRIEAGAMMPDKHWEDAGELVERVVRRLQSEVGDHLIVSDISPGLPLICVDAIQIEQVLTNLIENAAKYSPNGSPIVVSVQITGTEDADRQLSLAVADRGVGIPASERERIFTKFYRVAHPNRGIRGTGMGLAIVKGLVEAHGGRIAVESAPGHGSTFVLTLPAPSAPDSETPDKRLWNETARQ